MMPRRRSALARTSWAGAIVCCACSSPELSSTLFSCTKSTDCAPGQVCAPFQGQLACQHPPSAAASACQGSVCSADPPAARSAELQGEAPVPAGPVESSAGREGGRVSEGAPLSTREGGPQPLATTEPGDAGEGAGRAPLDAPAGTSPASPDAGPPDAGGTVEVADPPSVRFDFESSLEGWHSVSNQLPEDTLDGTERSTVLAHLGRGSLRMVYDGNYGPVPGVSASNGFYGAEVPDAPPPGAEVSLWMLSTAPDVSVEVFSRTDQNSARTTLATEALVQDEWREISFSMPLATARQFGVRVVADPALRGYVYLDEIRW